MKRYMLLALAISAAPAVAAAAPQPTPLPGFACSTLAPRQPLAGAPNVTFRVLKQTMSHEYPATPHKHKFGEILYLLSGSGTNTMNGKTTPLSADTALVVPADTDHVIMPTGKGGLTLLDVQFSDKATPAWKPKNFHGPSACSDTKKADPTH